MRPSPSASTGRARLEPHPFVGAATVLKAASRDAVSGIAGRMLSWAMDLAAQRAAYVQRLDAAVQEIVRTLSRIPGIRRVSLFGSYARGRRDLATDLDVLVVWETDEPFLERLRTLYARLDVGVDLDLICYTPAEHEGLAQGPFLRRLAQEEVVLFEAEPP